MEVHSDSRPSSILAARPASPRHPDAEATAPHGAAAEDANFTAGGDEVLYQVQVGDAPGPFAGEVSFLYQTLGARYAAQLFSHDTPAVREFEGYYEAADRTPVTLAQATATVE